MYLVGVAGGSGSGKTTLARRIWQRVGSSEVALLSQDSYYLPSPVEHLNVHGADNFDHPDAFDWPLLLDHLSRLKDGQEIQVPVYDYNLGRTSKTTPLGPVKVVILEGIFALWNESLRELLDLKIFVDVDADIRFIRRLHRDVKERGRSHDEVVRRYYDVVRPMHQLYIEPTRKYADLTIGEETEVASRTVCAQIRECLVQEEKSIK